MSKILLELKEIHKQFGEVEVLKGISLQIKEGEFITFLGPSGCGKTTTLRIVAGLEEPDTGQVLLNGVDVTNFPPEKRDINTVFQTYALFPHMDVEANIGYGLKIRKVPKREIKERVKKCLELVQLEGYEKRKPSELSGGQRQRVAIMRAVINNPKVLLLDEPLGALDLQLRRQMQLELKRLQKKLGITFIYITHDQEEAINMSDRIVVMKDGRFEQVGTPDEIYYAPKTSFVAGFVGNANIIRQKNRLLAVRSEHILIGEEAGEGFLATVAEKSYTGGMLRVVFVLETGEEMIASRHGINYNLEVGETTRISWKPEAAVEVMESIEDRRREPNEEEKPEA